MASVSWDGATKRFADGTVGLEKLDLEARDGELLVLVGPSGSGKSTALRLVAGLDTPTSGAVRIGDEVVDDVPPEERDVSMVFQSLALYPHMSVERNIDFPLAMRGVGRDERRKRVRETAELLGLEGMLDRRPGTLSGGQKQRVAIGRAIVRSPAVFLLDEPLSSLDAKLRVELRGEIALLQRRFETTTIYVTHDQVEAMTLGHRVAVLDQGQLLQVGAPDELYTDPDDAFVAAFIGSPGMNIFEARVAREEGAAIVEVGDQRVRVGAFRALEAIADNHEARGVQIGVRPEALGIAPEPGDRDDMLRGTITNVEELGHERLVHVELDGVETTIVARGSRDAPSKLGDEVGLTLELEALYAFEPSGARLRAGRGSSGASRDFGA